MKNKSGMGNFNFEYFLKISTFQRCDDGQTWVYTMADIKLIPIV